MPVVIFSLADLLVYYLHLGIFYRYMKIRDVPRSLERRILSWFDYIWSNKHMLDEENMLSDLPEKLRYTVYLTL